MQDVEQIERRIDRTAASALQVGADIGGLAVQNMGEVMEFAKLMAVAGAAVPSHLRGNPGACLAIAIQALEWKMSPFAVANKSYIAKGKGGEERIAFESQLIHAVIEARAPLTGRLRHEIIGEGDERRCRVWATFKGEAEPHSFTSETLAKLRDARGRNDYGNLKGSPLWESQPEVQLFYSASRQWCRLFAPDVLLGIYTPEELSEGPDFARDVTPARPSIADRLPGAGKAAGGFSADHVEKATETARGGGQVIDGTADQPAKRGRGRPRRDQTTNQTPASEQPAGGPPEGKADTTPAASSPEGQPVDDDADDAGEAEAASNPDHEHDDGHGVPLAEPAVGSAANVAGDGEAVVTEPSAAGQPPAAEASKAGPEPDNTAVAAPAPAAHLYAKGEWKGRRLADMTDAELAEAIVDALGSPKPGDHFGFRDAWSKTDMVGEMSARPKIARLRMQRIYDLQHDRVFSKADPAKTAAACAEHVQAIRDGVALT